MQSQSLATIPVLAQSHPVLRVHVPDIYDVDVLVLGQLQVAAVCPLEAVTLRELVGALLA